MNPLQRFVEFNKHYDLFRNFNHFFSNDKKLKLLFYKYFIPLIIKNKLVDEKFIEDYKKYQNVIRSFYAQFFLKSLMSKQDLNKT